MAAYAAEYNLRSDVIGDYCFLANLAVPNVNFRDPKLPFQKLRIAELVSLFDYTGGGYSAVNKALRSHDKDQLHKVGNFAKVLASALHTLPPHEGTVFRGTNLPEAVFQKYKKALETGQPIVEESFTSTSLNPAVALWHGVQHIYIIHSHQGRLVEAVSLATASEREALFPPGSEFKVKNIVEAISHTQFSKNYVEPYAKTASSGISEPEHVNLFPIPPIDGCSRKQTGTQVAPTSSSSKNNAADAGIPLAVAKDYRRIDSDGYTLDNQASEGIDYSKFQGIIGFQDLIVDPKGMQLNEVAGDQQGSIADKSASQPPSTTLIELEEISL